MDGGTIPNRVTLDGLMRMTVGQAATLAPDELAILADEAGELEQRAKGCKSFLTLVAAEKYAADIEAHTTGTVRVDAGAVEVVFNRAKRVDWDNQLLASVEQETSQAGLPLWSFFDVKRSISEREYDKLPADVRKRVDPARTVKAGSLSVKFEKKGAA